ncbi:tuberin-like [Patiria miniata]|uniref:Tuberin n=1 Tax=Patiria miniata TaxID=46514 RepID=A0A914A689_PATMI|nr:tuberin-like [Patiria miniata]
MARPASKESFKQRITSIFRRKESANIPNVATESRFEEFLITPALLKEIHRESPFSQRVKAVRDLCELVTTKRLEDNGIEALWAATADFLEPQVPMEHRHLMLTFMKCIIVGQNERLELMRAVFFEVIKKHSIFEDLPQRLDVLKSLSANGKNLLHFEEDMGPFLLAWMPDVISYGMTAEFLGLLVNVFKFNSCYLDDHIVSGLVRHTCTVCSRTGREYDIEQSLKVLEAVVCYSCLPTDALYNFVTALCRTVGVQEFAQASWKLMRNLFGTHLGHSAIYTMCSIMENGQNQGDVILLRGAVFYVGMARWGSMRVQSLKHNFTSVLPSFLKALRCKHPTVAYEVTLSLQRLVKKYGKDMQPVTWDIVLDIIEDLFRNIQIYSTHELLPDDLHDLLTTTELLHESKSFSGSASRLFGIVEEFANIRPESSVLTLVSFRAQSIHPTKVDWIQNLQGLMDSYFRTEDRTAIREAALRVLSSVLSSTSHLYEDDLIEMVVLPQLGHISEDPDPVVRQAAVHLLMDVAQVCQTHRCVDILDIIQKVVMRPMHTEASLGITLEPTDTSKNLVPHQRVAETDEDLVDIKAAVLSLMELFRSKLYRLPSNHCVLAFELLVKHMQAQYQHTFNSVTARTIRLMVFEYLLMLRSDSMYHIGLPDKDGNIRYSSYVLCDYKLEMDITGKTSPPSVCASPPIVERFCKTTFIPFADAFKVITTCLKYETDWHVLNKVSQSLAKALQNRTLVLASNANLDLLCLTLCTMVDDKSHIRRLHHTPQTFTRADFYVGVYRVLTALVPYHTQLENRRQVDLIKCLEAGLKLKCAQQCVDGLTLCVMEMQNTMVKILPSIILEMSKMSATPNMAIPVLEFLSSLIWFPHLYTSFVENQYMSIFAVALHYTNPFKFSLYVVSLAHHVIAMWFIKCRLAFRREFVNCITRGLRASSPKMSLDSPGRVKLRRSSSLTEKTSQLSKKDGGKSQEKTQESERASTEILSELHSLLTEGCLDMMARYAHSNCTTVPKRSPVAEFLLAGGQSQSWLLGNKIITITTSGGSSRMQKNGICEKCQSLIKLETGEDPKQCSTESSTIWKSGESSKSVDEPSGEQLALSKGFLRRQRSKSGEKSSSHGTTSPSSSPLPTDKSKSFEYNAPPTPEKSVSETRGSRANSPPPPKSGRTSGDSHKSKSGAASPGSTGRAGSPVVGELKPQAETSKEFMERVQASLHERAESSAAKLSSLNVYQCNCWCQGWAEVYVRRPTGNTSWIMRIENGGALLPTTQDFPLADISSLLLRNRELDLEIDAIEFEEDDDDKDDTEEMILEGDGKMGSQEKDVEHSNQSVAKQQANNLSPTTPDLHVSGESAGINDVGDETQFFPPVMVPLPFGSGPAIVVDPSFIYHGSSFSDDGDEDFKFSKPKLGQSPQVHHGISYFPGYTAAHTDTEDQSVDMATVIEDATTDLENITELVEDPTTDRRIFPRSSSCPNIMETLTSTGSAEAETEDPDELSTSPRTVVKSFQQKQAPISSSYKEMSILEQRLLLQDSAFGSACKDSDAHPTVNVQETTNQEGESKLQDAVDLMNKDLLQTEVVSTAAATSSAKFLVPPDDVSPYTPDQTQRRGGQKKPRPVSLPPQTNGEELQIHVATSDTKKQTYVGVDALKRQQRTELHSVGRPRGHTVASMVSSASNEEYTGRRRRTSENRPRVMNRTGLSPSFIFLQIYYSPMFSDDTERPMALPLSQVTQRAVKVLDRIPPYDTHKIGVLYVGSGQTKDQTAILSNVYGSTRYVEFLRGLGRLISLKDVSPNEVYTGGLDHQGSDGKFAYWWHDDIMQVIFHVATLMPNKESDPTCNCKKLHIGNDFVSIVYNESKEPYQLGTIKGQFNFAEIVIEPLDSESNLVTVQAKQDLEAMIGSRGPRMITNKNLPLLVRQMALHANLASQIYQSQMRGSLAEAYTSNWLERLRQIKRLRGKISQGAPSNTLAAMAATSSLRHHERRKGSSVTLDDFTDYA